MLEKYNKIQIVAIACGLSLLLPILCYRLDFVEGETNVPRFIFVLIPLAVQLPIMKSLTTRREKSVYLTWTVSSFVITIFHVIGVFLLKLQDQNIVLGALTLHLTIGYFILIFGALYIRMDKRN